MPSHGSPLYKLRLIAHTRKDVDTTAISYEERRQNNKKEAKERNLALAKGALLLAFTIGGALNSNKIAAELEKIPQIDYSDFDIDFALGTTSLFAAIELASAGLSQALIVSNRRVMVSQARKVEAELPVAGLPRPEWVIKELGTSSVPNLYPPADL